MPTTSLVISMPLRIGTPAFINVDKVSANLAMYMLFAIFIIAIVHEFSHGIVARAHNVEVKNTGIVLFGPIIGAFVEPNEKKLRKENDVAQYSILAAGAFSNILLAVIALVSLSFVFMPLQQGMIEPLGFTFDEYFGEDYPFEQAGVPKGSIITAIDDTPTSNLNQLSEKLFCSKPGDVITVQTGQESHQVTLTENPSDPNKGFMGVATPRNEFKVKEKYESGIWNILYFALDWWNGFLRWLFLLSLGIGLFNLLPLPIVDGGRMAQVFLHRLKGSETGEKRYRQISIFFVLVLLLNLLFPWFIKLF